MEVYVDIENSDPIECSEDKKKFDTKQVNNDAIIIIEDDDEDENENENEENNTFDLSRATRNGRSFTYNPSEFGKRIKVPKYRTFDRTEIKPTRLFGSQESHKVNFISPTKTCYRNPTDPLNTPLNGKRSFNELGIDSFVPVEKKYLGTTETQDFCQKIDNKVGIKIDMNNILDKYHDSIIEDAKRKIMRKYNEDVFTCDKAFACFLSHGDGKPLTLNVINFYEGEIRRIPYAVLHKEEI